MPPKARKLSDLTDDEIEAERKRRRAANKPKYVEVHRMTEEQYQRLLRSSDVAGEEDDENDDEDDDAEGGDDDKGGSRYFS